MNVEHLTIAFNAEFGTGKGECAIRSAIKNHGFKCGRPPSERMVDRYRVYTPEQLEFLKDGYRTLKMEHLVIAFNAEFGTEKTEQKIKACVSNHGFRSGRTGYFKKGHIPHNKGVEGWDSGGNSHRTRFKEDQRGSKWVPIGSERLSKDGILQRKIRDTKYAYRNWKSVHSLLWEKHNGPVPKGHVVVFRDKDRTRIEIENLECITREENMRRNSLHNMPEPLKDVIRIRGVLNRHINKRDGKNEK